MDVLRRQTVSAITRLGSEDESLDPLLDAEENLRQTLAGIAYREICGLIEQALKKPPLYRACRTDNYVYRVKIADIPDVGWQKSVYRRFDTIAKDWLESATRGGFKGIPFEVKREYTGLYLYWSV